MDLQLQGRVVLVTGGSSGLGAATASRLVSEGASVAICARDPDRLAVSASKMSDGPGEVLAVPADVRRAEQLEAFVEAAHRQWGRIDAVVNNAGGGARQPFESITDDSWTDDLELKLFAAIRSTRYALPHLRTSSGSIVNVLAIAARAPGAGSMPSSVSRAAGLALTKALSQELAPDGVRVNAVLIGVVRAGGHDRTADAQGLDREQYYEQLAARRAVPLGRVGLAEELADLVAFLVSNRSAYLTGTAINVDGGESPVI